MGVTSSFIFIVAFFVPLFPASTAYYLTPGAIIDGKCFCIPEYTPPPYASPSLEFTPLTPSPEITQSQIILPSPDVSPSPEMSFSPEPSQSFTLPGPLRLPTESPTPIADSPSPEPSPTLTASPSMSSKPHKKVHKIYIFKYKVVYIHRRRCELVCKKHGCQYCRRDKVRRRKFERICRWGAFGKSCRYHSKVQYSFKFGGCLSHAKSIDVDLEYRRRAKYSGGHVYVYDTPSHDWGW